MLTGTYSHDSGSVEMQPCRFSGLWAAAWAPKVSDSVTQDSRVKSMESVVPSRAEPDTDTLRMETSVCLSVSHNEMEITVK